MLQAVDAGLARAQIVRLFGVSLPTIRRYLKQRRAVGHLTPKVSPGRPLSIKAQEQAALEAQVRAAADATLQQHCQQWHSVQAGLVSTATMSRAIRRLDWTRKKST